jgi:phosphoribosyl-AMP cyclohydrolase
VNRTDATEPETPTRLALPFLSQIKWDADGLVPAIVQDEGSGEVLMMAWMDEPALRRTLETGQTHFYSRSRRSAWHKGGTSGHVQHVAEVLVDCDADVVLIRARQVGGACHEGYRSCFSRRVGPGGGLERVTEPVFSAEAVYGRGPHGAAGPGQAAPGGA